MAEKLILAVVGNPGPMVTLTNGSRFPFHGVVEVDLGEIVLTLDIGVEDGQPVVNRAAMDRAKRMQVWGPDGPVAMRGEDGPPLTPASIRGAVSEEVLNAAVDALARTAVRRDMRDEDDAGSATQETRARRPITDELLREVAAVVQSGPLGQPNRAVCLAFNYGPRQASRLIAAALDGGFLDERLLKAAKGRRTGANA